MARPRRNTAEAFYDVFADMPLEDQAAALKILEQVHRLAMRANRAAAMAQVAADDLEYAAEARSAAAAMLPLDGGGPAEDH